MSDHPTLSATSTDAEIEAWLRSWGFEPMRAGDTANCERCGLPFVQGISDVDGIREAVADYGPDLLEAEGPSKGCGACADAVLGEFKAWIADTN